MDWHSRTITTNGIELHYHRTGGGKPPLVLCHGITDNGLCWMRAAYALANDFDLIMVDARGHGLSAKSKTGYSALNHAVDLASLIEQLVLKRTYLMGHSMGAEISALVAAHYPNLVGKLILEDPPWNSSNDPDSSKEDRERIANEWQTDILKQQSLTTAEIIATKQITHPTWSEIEFRPWATAKQQVDPNVFGFITESRPGWAETVAKISCPTLLITGDVNAGAIVSHETANSITARKTNFEVVHIPGAGHNIRREQFDRVIEAIREFLIEGEN